MPSSSSSRFARAADIPARPSRCAGLILLTHTLITYALCRAAEHLYLLLLPKLLSETIFFSVTVKVKRICRF